MECCNWGAQKFFLLLARVYFGTWMLYVGITKWIYIGAAAFVDMIHSQFDATWSPALLNEILAWIILCAEPIVGIWLLLGCLKRKAWVAASALMFLLTFGMTIAQQHQIVSSNWFYLVFTMACAALSEPECDAS